MPEEKKDLGFDLGLDAETIDPFELSKSEAGRAFVSGGKKPRTRDRRKGSGKYRTPTAGGKLIRITADLEPGLHKRLKMAALRDNIAQKQLISDLIDEGLKARREAAKAAGEED